MSTSGSFTPAGEPACYEPRMTRAAALAMQTAGTLRENCVVVITDGPVIGTAGNTSPTEVELNPVSPTELGTSARVHTTFAANAWDGVYEIGLGNGTLTYLRDDWGNEFTDVDANAPQLQAQFPWHLGGPTLRNNVFTEATLTGWDTLTAARFVQGNTVHSSTVDVTGWSSGGMFRSRIENSSSVTTGPTLTLNTAHLHSATVTNSGTGGISVQQNSSVYQSTLANDPGSVKSLSVIASDLRGVTLRTQAGTVAASTSVNSSRLRGQAGGGSVVHLGDAGLNITRADVDFSTTWTVDGPAGANVNVRDCTLDGVAVNRSAIAGRCDIQNGYFAGTVFDHQGSGQIIATQGVHARNGTLRLTAASTGSLAFQRSTLEDAVVQVTDVRSLSVLFGSYVGGLATVTESGTTPTTAASIGDRIDGSRIEGGAQLTFSTTTGSNTNEVSRTVVRGSSVVGEGVVTISGTTDGGWVDNCEILGGIVTIDNASSGLSGASAFTGNHVGPGCTLSYTGGDSTAKQIRNNRVEGQSTLTCSALTGSAGGGLGDVFSMSVRGQSALTVSGARVVGQPVRDCTVEQGSVLTVPAGGCVQRCRVAGGATVNTGAFVHFDTEVSGAFTKTLTAANLNRLANKAYDDCL